MVASTEISERIIKAQSAWESPTTGLRISIDKFWDHYNKLVKSFRNAHRVVGQQGQEAVKLYIVSEKLAKLKNDLQNNVDLNVSASIDKLLEEVGKQDKPLGYESLSDSDLRNNIDNLNDKMKELVDKKWKSKSLTSATNLEKKQEMLDGNIHRYFADLGLESAWNFIELSLFGTTTLQTADVARPRQVKPQANIELQNKIEELENLVKTKIHADDRDVSYYEDVDDVAKEIDIALEEAGLKELKKMFAEYMELAKGYCDAMGKHRP